MASAYSEKNALNNARENIGKQYAVLIDGYQRGDWNVTTQIYGPNCTILAPDCPTIKGKDAAQRYWKAIKDELNVTKIEIKCDELNGSGDWYFERGIYKLISDEKLVEQRKYVKIWRKYQGKMVIHSYMYNRLPME